MMPWPIEHWHAAVSLGFRAYPSGVAYMSGVQASRGYPGDAMMEFFSRRLFDSPAIDVAAQIRSMRDALLVAFGEGEQRPFHGARRPPSLTPVQRGSIAATARAFLGKDIWWTWANMLDYKWFTWDGTIEDIDNVRCDGVVEYAFEKNDVRVCAGKNADLWNISHGHNENVRNHNNA